MSPKQPSSGRRSTRSWESRSWVRVKLKTGWWPQVGMSMVNGEYNVTGWWFGTRILYNFMTFHILGKQSQLTFIFFSRCRYTTNQVSMNHLILVYRYTQWLDPSGPSQMIYRDVPGLRTWCPATHRHKACWRWPRNAWCSDLAASAVCEVMAFTLSWNIWVCLKIGYIPNYSHLIGIMIINHWV